MTKYLVTNVRPRADGEVLGRMDDFEIEVEFPENYDGLTSNDTIIEDAVWAKVVEAGWDCNSVDYHAGLVEGTGSECEERIRLRMGG